MAAGRLLARAALAAFLLVESLPPAGPRTAGAAPDAAIAFVGARVHTVSDGTLERGTVLVRGGRIAAVGPADEVEVPPDARVVQLHGRVLVPGLVDTHSHIGIYPRPLVFAHRDGNDTSKPVQPGLRAVDGLWPEDPGIRMAVAGGITTANVMPGSANVVGGQTAYVKLRGDTVEEMLLEVDGVHGGLKMANGENPKRAYGQRGKAPVTRMAIAAMQRDLFLRAGRYRERWERYREKSAAGEEADEPDRDPELEAVVEVLEGRRIVHHHTHRSDDIMSVLRLREEFGFEVVLHHATEAYKVVDEVAAAGVPVSLLVLDSPGGKLETAEYRRDYAATLEAAGVPVAIHSDDFITPSRLFLRSGALAVRAGMSEEGALAALTLEGASPVSGVPR